MKNRKMLWIIPALLAVCAVLGWVLLNYHIVGFRLYSREAQRLDLRGQEIRVEEFETLREKLPQCEIRWDVPYRDTLLPDDARTIEIVNMDPEDIPVLDHLTELQTVIAKGSDYAQYAALQQRRPEIQVHYSIPFSGQQSAQDTVRIEADRVDQKQLELLQYLPELETVVYQAGGTMDNAALLQDYCKERGIAFFVELGGEELPEDTEDVVVSAVTEEELALLPLLRGLKTLHLVDPKAQPESVAALRELYPEVQITWEVSFADQVFTDDAVEVDLSMVVVEDLEDVERKLSYLPDLETAVFGLCGLDEPKWENSRSKLAASPIENETMSAYRDRVRESYKVVWTVRLGPSIALRTDADNFMPNHFGVGQLPDSYAYNLRYCEDMVCLDVGHMTLTDISFVEFMPKLKYLILAWTEIQYIEPIRSCKNLIFLEVDNSCIRDYSPIADCTALEDLNIGNTFCDITPILEMTWLKNLYMILGHGGYAYQAAQALPNTRVIASGDATVGSGWRRLPNYYDMRDCLGMYYMN